MARHRSLSVPKKFDMEPYLGLIKTVESDIFNNPKMIELIGAPSDSMEHRLNNMTLREYLQLEGGDPAKIPINIVDYLQKRYKKEIAGLAPPNLYQIARRIISEIHDYKEN